MTDPTHVGASIKEAIGNAQTVMREVNAFLGEVDRELDDLRLTSVTGAEMFLNDYSRSLGAPTGWLQSSLARLYGAGGRLGDSEQVVAVEVHLSPVLFNEAVVVIGWASGDDAVAGMAWYTRYKSNAWFLSLYDAKPAFGEERQWDEARRPAVLPGARSLRAVVLPLDAMKDREAIRSEIVARCRGWLAAEAMPAPAA